MLTSVQLDPGTAELLQNVVGNLTNITMLTNMLAVRALGRMHLQVPCLNSACSPLPKSCQLPALGGLGGSCCGFLRLCTLLHPVLRHEQTAVACARAGHLHV